MKSSSSKSGSKMKYYETNPKFEVVRELEAMGNYRAALEQYQQIFQDSKNSEEIKGRALYRIGLLYKDGLGVSQDVRKAFSFFQMASERGSGNASFQLADLYIKYPETFKTDNPRLTSRKLSEQAQTQQIEKITGQELEMNIAQKNFTALHQKLSSFLPEGKELDSVNEQNQYLRLALSHEHGIGTQINLEKAQEYYNKFNPKINFDRDDKLVTKNISASGYLMLYKQYVELSAKEAAITIAKKELDRAKEQFEADIKNLKVPSPRANENLLQKQKTYDELGGDKLYSLKKLLIQAMKNNDFPYATKEKGIKGLYSAQYRVNPNSELLLKNLKSEIEDLTIKLTFAELPADTLEIISELSKTNPALFHSQIQEYQEKQNQNYITIKNRDEFTSLDIALLKEHDEKIKNDPEYAASFYLYASQQEKDSTQKAELLNNSLSSFKQHLIVLSLELEKADLSKSESKSQSTANNRDPIQLIEIINETQQKIRNIYRDIEKLEEKRILAALEEKGGNKIPEVETFNSAKTLAKEKLGKKEQELEEKIDDNLIYQRAKQKILAEAKQELAAITRKNTDPEVKTELGRDRKSMDSIIITGNYASDLELVILRNPLSVEQEKAIKADPNAIERDDIAKILKIKSDALYELALCYKYGKGGVEVNSRKYDELLIQSIATLSPKIDEKEFISNLKDELHTISANLTRSVMQARDGGLAEEQLKGIIGATYSEHISGNNLTPIRQEIKNLLLKNPRANEEIKSILSPKGTAKTVTPQEISLRTTELAEIELETRLRKADLARFQNGKLSAFYQTASSIPETKETKEQPKYNDFVTHLFKKNPYSTYVKYQKLMLLYHTPENLKFIEVVENFKKDFNSQTPDQRLAAFNAIYQYYILPSSNFGAGVANEKETVNISSDLVEILKKTINEANLAKTNGAVFNIDPNIFDASYKEVVTLLHVGDLKPGSPFTVDISAKNLPPAKKIALDGISKELLEAAEALDRAIAKGAPLAEIELLKEEFLQLNIRNLKEESSSKIVTKDFQKQMVRFISNLKDTENQSVSEIFKEDGNAPLYKNLIANKTISTIDAIYLLETLKKLKLDDPNYQKLFPPIDDLIGKFNDAKDKNSQQEWQEEATKYFDDNPEFFANLAKYIKSNSQFPITFIDKEEGLELPKYSIIERLETSRKSPKEIEEMLTFQSTLNPKNIEELNREWDSKLKPLLESLNIDPKLITLYYSKLQEIGGFNQSITTLHEPFNNLLKTFEGLGDFGSSVPVPNNNFPKITEHKGTRALLQQELVSIIKDITIQIDEAKINKENQQRDELLHILKENLHKLDDGSVHKTFFRNQNGEISKKSGEGFEEIQITDAYVENLLTAIAPDLLDQYRVSLAQFRQNQAEFSKDKYDETAKDIYSSLATRSQKRLDDLRIDLTAKREQNLSVANALEAELSPQSKGDLELQSLMILSGRVKTTDGRTIALTTASSAAEFTEVANLYKNAGLEETTSKILQASKAKFETVKEKNNPNSLPPAPPENRDALWDPRTQELKPKKLQPSAAQSNVTELDVAENFDIALPTRRRATGGVLLPKPPQLSHPNLEQKDPTSPSPQDLLKANNPSAQAAAPKPEIDRPAIPKRPEGKKFGTLTGKKPDALVPPVPTFAPPPPPVPTAPPPPPPRKASTNPATTLQTSTTTATLKPSATQDKGQGSR